MTQTHFNLIYSHATFQIVDGPHAGKNTLMQEVNLFSNTFTSKGGTVLPMELVKPVLRPITAMNIYEAADIYKLYWHTGSADDWSGDNGSANFRPRKVSPTIEHAMRIFDGKDFSAGDFGEWQNIFAYMIAHCFHVFNNNLAILKP